MPEHIAPDLSYKPKKIVMFCGDGRFRRTFIAAAEANSDIKDENDPNEIKVAGPARHLTDPKTQETVLDNIGAFIEFFESDTLALYEHMPCGWMKKKAEGYAEADDQGKIEIHDREIKAAGAVLKHSFPDLVYEPHLIGADGKEILLPSVGWLSAANA